MGRTLVLLSSLLAAAGPACSSSTPPAQEPAPETTAAPSDSASSPASAATSTSGRFNAPPGSRAEPAPDSSPPGSRAEPAPDSSPPGSRAEPAARVQTLFVHETRVDCEGAMPMKCLKVRESEQDEWSYFYSTIEGFDYEESFRYELRVEIESIPNPPMDSGTLRYRLLEVVSKQPAKE